MKIYLAGENGKKRIIGKMVNETIISGETRHWLNLPLIEENENAAVFGGRILQKIWETQSSRLHGGIVPEVIDEGSSCKPAHDTKIQERAAIRNSPIRGGIPDEVTNEDISGRASIIADQKYRGALTTSLKHTALLSSNRSTMLMRPQKS